jgi:hypothetical protein
VPFGDLLQGGGAAGEALADRAGQERASRFGAQPGDFSGQRGDVLVGAGDVRAGGIAAVQGRVPGGAADLTIWVA